MTRDELKTILEMECAGCEGKGKFSDPPAENGYVHEWNCKKCGGRGTVLTDVGNYVIGLVGHHMDYELEREAYGSGYVGFVGKLFHRVRSAAWWNRGGGDIYE